jgi:hypothetical protein
MQSGIGFVFFLTATTLVKRKLLTMKSLWIIGAGKFGIKSATVLKRKNPDVEITVVDSSSHALRSLQDILCKTVCEDGITYLFNHLNNAGSPDWIIPVIPVHVAYEWIKKKLSEEYLVQQHKVPDDIAKTLPNVISGQKGEIYISYADFVCPDNCSEPVNICTYTGKPRLGILHQRLEAIAHQNYRPIVIQSVQLAPGIGGLRPNDLFNALKTVLAVNSPIFLSTACKCHGVMHAFEIKSKRL